jgi:glycosyltransferase involved in cell wall biosynthesis
MGQHELLASVIVPVRGRASDVESVLAALAAQTLPADRFEVIVGEDGFVDGSIAALAAGGRFRVSTGPARNSYAARNRAARAAGAPILAFCDADCVPETDWLEAGLAALGSCDLAAGLVRFMVPRQASVWTYLDIDTFLDQERAVRAGRAATANLFVRRCLFEAQGGFDESVPNSSDYDFVGRCVASGARLAFAPDASVLHPTRNDARAVLRKTWAVNRHYAERERRAGRRPNALRAREWVPIVQPLRARRRFGRSLGLDRARFAQNGIRPSGWDNARALPLMYVGLPYVGCAAQLVGWFKAQPSA